MTNPKTVLIVSHTAVNGGAELALVRYANRKPSSNIKFLFVQDGDAAQAVKQAVPDTIISDCRTILQQIRAINSAIARTEPTLVISNSMRAAVLVALCRVKRSQHIYYLRDLLNADHLSIYKRIVTKTVMKARVGGLIANSGATLNSVQDSRLKTSAQIAYSCSGISIDSIENAKLRGIPDSLKPLRLLSLSRISPWKGQDKIIDALRLVYQQRQIPQEIELTIAGTALFGEDAYEKEIKNTASNSLYEIKFTGHVTDIDTLLENHDVLVHASRSPEPFGQVIVQGLGSGLAVTATKGGGPEEIATSISQPSVFLWDGNVPESLASVLISILDHRDELEKRIANGYVVAAMYSDESAAASLERAIHQHLERSTRELVP